MSKPRRWSAENAGIRALGNVLPRYSAADCHWSHLMRWLSALSNFELMLFIVTVGVLVAGGLLLLEITGVSLFRWQ